MKVADFFTALRIALAPIFFILYFLPEWVGFSNRISVWILFPLFIFIGLTDFLDGYFARKLKQVSDFGKLFDPFGDVLANMTIMFVFVIADYMPAFLFLLVLYREMSITFVRMLASRNGVAIAARMGGKLKTVLYIVASGFSLLRESFFRLDVQEMTDVHSLALINILLYSAAVLAAVISFFDYIRCYYLVLKKSKTA